MQKHFFFLFFTVNIFFGYSLDCVIQSEKQFKFLLKNKL